MEETIVSEALSLSSLMSNEIFVGLIVATIIGSLIIRASEIFKAVNRFMLKQFTVQLVSNNTVSGHNDVENKAQEILGQRRRMLASGVTSHRENNGSITETIRFTPGLGKHFCFWKKRLVIIDVHQQEAKTNFTPSTLTISAFTRNKEFFDDFKSGVEDKNQGFVKINTWNSNWWSESQRKKRRDISTLILPDNKGELLINDLKKFYKSFDWYAERGIPYKRGYLLHGVPGSGKSTLAFLMASETKRNLKTISISDFEKDSSFTEAVSSIGAGSILLIEDIDAAGGNVTREDDKVGVSLSTILNALDGVATPEGLVFILTTNKKHSLDKALIRPGRIDVDIEFNHITREQAYKAFISFFPNYKHLAAPFANGIMEKKPMCFAELQEKLMKLDSIINSGKLVH